MVITRTKTLENNIYYAEIKVTDLTIQEKDLLKTYGDPMIDLGGNFDTFSVPHYYRKLYENSPHKYYNEDESKVTTWLDNVEERIQTAITTLKNLSNSNKWSGTIVYPFWTGSDIKYKDGSTETIADKIDNIMAYPFWTGSDIKYKDGSTETIADKIDNIMAYPFWTGSDIKYKDDSTETIADKIDNIDNNNIIKVIAKTDVSENIDYPDLIPAGHLLTNVIVKNTTRRDITSLFITGRGEGDYDIISNQEIDAFNFFTCPIIIFYPENTTISIHSDFWNSASLDIYFVLIKIY